MIDKPEAAQDEARVNAIKQARIRAELYARVAGLKVKRIISMSEGEAYSGGAVLQQSLARDASSDAKSEVLPGAQSIAVTISVVFELE